jgi:hypothetical protein
MAHSREIAPSAHPLRRRHPSRIEAFRLLLLRKRHSLPGFAFAADGKDSSLSPNPSPKESAGADIDVLDGQTPARTRHSILVYRLDNRGSWSMTQVRSQSAALALALNFNFKLRGSRQRSRVQTIALLPP